MSRVHSISFAVVLAVGVLWGSHSQGLRAQSAPAKKATPKAATGHAADLQRDLQRASQLLEQDKLAEFIEEFFPVDVLRQIRQHSRVKVAAATAKLQPEARETLQQLTKLLKQSSTAKVSLLQDDSLAIVRITLVPPKVTATEKPMVPTPAPVLLSVPGLGKDVTAAVKEAQRLLSTKDYAGFVLRTLPEHEAQRLVAEKQLDTFVASLTENPEVLAAMVQDIQSMAKQKPQLNGPNDAEFRLESNEQRAVGPRAVKLQLVNGNWRFFDHTKALREKIRTGGSGGSDPAGPEEFVLQWERFGTSWRLFTMEITPGEGFLEPEGGRPEQFAPKALAPPIAPAFEKKATEKKAAVPLPDE